MQKTEASRPLSSLEETSKGRPNRVFVFLGEGFGATRWRKAQSANGIPGVNDQLPYGFFRAANELWNITYSEDRLESWPRRLFRRVLRRLLGFDLLHAWYNREELCNSDVVWTNTEMEYLAALCLWRIRPGRRRPKLIAQSVWLFDRWAQFGIARQLLYRRLIKDAELLTTLSPDNLQVARSLFPEKRCEMVHFGIEPNSLRPVAPRRIHQPIRILSLGSDMHRDWNTLIAAASNWDKVEVRIASKAVRRRRGLPANVTALEAKTARQVYDLYDWADIVVVSLKPNLHVSGITVIAEAVALGVPVISTDTGGLRAYFHDDELSYVEHSQPLVLRKKIEELAADDAQRFDKVVRAQRRIVRDNLTSDGHAVRYRELSESLMMATENV
jgi:glycosyltransferase involved in cell wall biosynthesis